MSSSRVLVFAASTILFAGASTFAFTACSSDSSSGAADAVDAGTDSAKEAGPPKDSGTDSGQTVEECDQQCETDHPAGLAKHNLIDTCWSQHCQAPCVDESGGFDAGDPDGGDGGDAGGMVCASDVQTVSPDCDNCTNAFCCAAWDGCFQDTDCSALDDCYGGCEGP